MVCEKEEIFTKRIVELGLEHNIIFELLNKHKPVMIIKPKLVLSFPKNKNNVKLSFFEKLKLKYLKGVKDIIEDRKSIKLYLPLFLNDYYTKVFLGSYNVYSSSNILNPKIIELFKYFSIFDKYFVIGKDDYVLIEECFNRFILNIEKGYSFYGTDIVLDLEKYFENIIKDRKELKNIITILKKYFSQKITNLETYSQIEDIFKKYIQNELYNTTDEILKWFSNGMKKCKELCYIDEESKLIFL